MKWKRFLAATGIICIAAIYAAALIAAFSHSPNASNWLMAAIFSTVAVPVMIYAIQLAAKVLKHDDHKQKH